jgi:hypothetical protein
VRTPWKPLRKCQRTRSLTDFPTVAIKTPGGSGSRGHAKGCLVDRGTTAFPFGLEIVRHGQWRPPVSADLRAFFLPHSSRLNHDGVHEPNYGKAVVECKENLGLGTADRSEIQVLTGTNRHHDHTLGIREGSADGDIKGFHSH